MPNPSIKRYFSIALIMFLLSFVLMASSKWTNNLYYALIALPGLVLLVYRRGAQVFSVPLTWGWVLFFAWLLIPALRAGEGQFYKHIVYTLLFLLILGGLVDVKLLRSGVFARAMFWCVCLYIYACAAWIYFHGTVAFGARVSLLLGRMDNVIYTSIWLVSSFALSLPAWTRGRLYLELFGATLLSVVAVAFVLQTRTALVGCAFVAGVWALYSLFRSPRTAIPIILGLLLSVSAVAWYVHDEAWAVSLVGRGDSSRIALFEIMTGEWRRCGWLLGCGVDFHTAQVLPNGEAIQHPHNIFVATGLYFGGGAFVVFSALMAASLWLAWKMRNPWGLYLSCSLLMLNFDGSKPVGNPDELWPLVLMPAGLILADRVRRKLDQKVSPAPVDR